MDILEDLLNDDDGNGEFLRTDPKDTNKLKFRFDNNNVHKVVQGKKFKCDLQVTLMPANVTNMDVIIQDTERSSDIRNPS